MKIVTTSNLASNNFIDDGFLRKSVSGVMQDVFPLPPEAYFLGMCSDGLPLLQNLNMKWVNILFYGKYDLPTVYLVNRLREKNDIFHAPLKVNYFTVPKELSESMDGHLDIMGRLEGPVGRTVVYVEDFHSVVVCFQKQGREVELEAMLKNPNIFWICNSTEYIGEWSTHFQVCRPSKNNTFRTECGKSETIVVYCPYNDIRFE